MWEIDIKLQLLNFFRSGLLGMLFCIFYDFLRAVRRNSTPSAIRVLFQDIFYFLVLAPVTFCFFLAATNGEIRSFVFIGIIGGFIILRYTLSPIITKIFAFFIGLIKKLFYRAKRVLDYIFEGIFRIFERFFSICRIFLKNFRKANIK